MGLIENAQGAAAPQQPQGQPQGMTAGAKQQQDQTLKALQLGRKLIYSKNIFASLIQQMSGDQATPEATLAEAIVMILDKLNEDTKLPLNVVFGTGLLLMSDVVEALNRTGRFNFTAESIEKALGMAVQMFLQTSGGGYSDEELQEGMAQLQAGGM